MHQICGMNRQIALIALIFLAGGYGRGISHDRKCLERLGMCESFACISSEYPKTEAARISDILTNISCVEGERVEKYGVIYDYFTTPGRKTEFWECGFYEDTPGDEVCQETINTYKCGIIAVAANAGSGPVDEPYVARLTHWRLLLTSVTLKPELQKPLRYCWKSINDALDAMGAGIEN
ncbi:unnamed protein product, partial [Mesorhabditis spiculigera]